MTVDFKSNGAQHEMGEVVSAGYFEGRSWAVGSDPTATTSTKWEVCLVQQ